MDLIPFRSQCRYIMYNKLSRLITVINHMIVKESMLNLTDRVLNISYAKLLKKLDVKYTFDNFPFKALQGHYIYECIFIYYRVSGDNIFLCFDLDNCYAIDYTRSISSTISLTSIIEGRRDILTDMIDDIKMRLEIEKKILFDNTMYDVNFDVHMMIDIILKRLIEQDISVSVNQISASEYTITQLDRISVIDIQ